jgi:hypothetical protein
VLDPIKVALAVGVVVKALSELFAIYYGKA